MSGLISYFLIYGGFLTLAVAIMFTLRAVKLI